ncbi:hypothetical protein AVEN_128119-1 [Araneus ventricosus]|uniref:Uncharacterized protein n=1 Tax=Araneus ventricosus TaxID=182803 RepID=A0A4Y2A0V8_ARAVE|nr:hypothetical protein AVEN_128119-1 [Araneus ventricosus]
MVLEKEINTNGKHSGFCNLQRVTSVHDWESYKVRDVFDDGTMTFFWRAHTLTVLFLLTCALVYVAFFEELSTDLEYNVKRLWAQSHGRNFLKGISNTEHFGQNGTARPNVRMAESQARIEALSKSNFERWKLQMEAMLIKNDRFKYVLEVAPSTEPKEAYDSWKIEDSKTKADLILCIQPSELKLVKNCLMVKDMWEKLERT